MSKLKVVHRSEKLAEERSDQLVNNLVGSIIFSLSRDQIENLVEKLFTHLSETQ